MATIDLGYRPRDWQVRLHKDKTRFKVLVIHRRGGKTVGSIADMLDHALRCTLKNPRYAYIAPFLKQAKAVAWDILKDLVREIPGVKINESELRVDLPNKARIQLFGADNYDALRGIYLDGAVLDEFGDVDPRAWAEVIRPALSDREGWATFIGTPKGTNDFYKLFNYAKEPANDNWSAFMLKASESGLIPESELKDARGVMTEDQYDQEYECNFDAPVIGSYYGKEIRQLEKAKQITSVPWEPKLDVQTAWDIGIDDSTAIWFVQTVGREIHVIDYMEVNDLSAGDIAKKLKEKPYAYGEMILPHDAGGREKQTGMTYEDALKGLGFPNTRVLSMAGVMDGINAARMLLPKIWFDETKCERGLKCLKNYQREWDDKHQVYRSRPLHNWASHGADAFRYLAMGYEPPRKSKPMKRRRYASA